MLTLSGFPSCLTHSLELFSRPPSTWFFVLWVLTDVEDGLGNMDQAGYPTEQ